ncbi:MAG: arsenic efflux protein [Lachnospiraceae bacterium]|nr:arsenic efflux protein [Lachnospiraceae bacterium]
MSHFLEILEHTLLDNVKLIPFLFLTYLVMEALEHKAGDKTNQMVKKAGRFGPIVGALVGALPQCGFSTAASNLYAGRVITLGTLMAIYLSTSDEMLPILLSENVAVTVILKLLAIKVIIGMVAGLAIDAILFGKKEEHEHIHEMCEEENCHCEKGILHSALVHTIHITLFILLISFVLNFVIHEVGEEALGQLLLNKPVVGPLVAGIVGLIPNCASSVVITQLYLGGALGLGAMMAGLLVNAGVGVLVLFRVNKNRKENLTIVALLYVIGVVAGILLDVLPINL